MAITVVVAGGSNSNSSCDDCGLLTARIAIKANPLGPGAGDGSCPTRSLRQDPTHYVTA